MGPLMGPIIKSNCTCSKVAPDPVSQPKKTFNNVSYFNSSFITGKVSHFFKYSFPASVLEYLFILI